MFLCSFFISLNLEYTITLKAIYGYYHVGFVKTCKMKNRYTLVILILIFITIKGSPRFFFFFLYPSKAAHVFFFFFAIDNGERGKNSLYFLLITERGRYKLVMNFNAKYFA